MRKRASSLIEQIDNAVNLPYSEWEIWSGEFNRHLRKLMNLDTDDHVKRYGIVFGYWQVKDKILRLETNKVNDVTDLVTMANDLKTEVLSEEK